MAIVSPLQKAGGGYAKPVKQTSKPIPIPAPSKGLDAISDLAQMDPASAIYLYNLNPTQFGCRVRPGYQNWVSGITESGGVRTVITVNAGETAGVTSALFICTLKGIYNATNQTSSPTLLVTFGSPTGNAGWGKWSAITDGNGNLIIAYCDEVNGLYYYNASTSTWTKATEQAAGTASASGSTMTVSGATIATFQVGSVITGTGVPANTTITALGTGTGGNGTYTVSTSGGWSSTAVVGAAPYQIGGVDPGTFVDVVYYASRLMFVQAGTGYAWYLQTAGAIYGQAASFPFGPEFQHGGNLNSVWTYTLESSFYLLEYLVTISDAGDVVLWQGTDITNASDWAIHGKWYVGDLPAGRRVASNYGGDLLILSQFGIIQVSNLISGEDIANPESFLSVKIAPAIAADIQNTQGTRGWDIVPWPSENGLLVIEPVLSGQTPKQWLYNLVTKAWTIYQLPIQCGASWLGTLYSGTADGRCLQHTGTQDNVGLSGMAAAISWGCLGAFSSVGAPGLQKFIDLLRPIFVSDQPVAYTVFGRYNYDLSGLTGLIPSLAPTTDGSAWDAGRWDSATWSGGGGGTGQLSPQIAVSGAAGLGSTIAVGLLGNSTGHTTLVGYEAMARAGGFL